MLCPLCKIELRMMDRQGVEVDYCPTCRGIWLDRGELDRLLERATVAAAGEAGRGAPYSSSRGDDRRDRERERDHDDHYRGSYPKQKRKGGWLGELLDFD